MPYGTKVTAVLTARSKVAATPRVVELVQARTRCAVLAFGNVHPRPGSGRCLSVCRYRGLTRRKTATEDDRAQREGRSRSAVQPSLRLLAGRCVRRRPRLDAAGFSRRRRARGFFFGRGRERCNRRPHTFPTRFGVVSLPCLPQKHAKACLWLLRVRSRGRRCCCSYRCPKLRTTKLQPSTKLQKMHTKLTFKIPVIFAPL